MSNTDRIIYRYDMKRKVIVAKEDLERALAEYTSAFKACQSLGLMFTTFKRRCVEYGIYVTNQGGRGQPGHIPTGEKAPIPLEDIFSGKRIAFGQGLKRKLLKAGLLKDECAICGLGPEWQGKKLTLQLDHIDGDRLNASKENLRILCPNCHSQTHTFSRGKNNCARGGTADTPA